MQFRSMGPIVCCIFSLSLLFAQEAQPMQTGSLLSNGDAELQISLLTDKRSYSAGDEIHFEITFSNSGGSPFRILIDDIFVGDHIQFADMEGNIYPFEGGFASWSPKAGVFVGRTHLLKPGVSIVIKLDALVYDDYRVIFSNLFDRTGSSNFQGLKKHNNLPPDFPDKYVCAGRIIPLPEANQYRLTYIYETGEADSYWTFTNRTPEESSLDMLWIGRAVSNSVEISIQ